MVRLQQFSILPPFGGLPPEEWYTYINQYDSVAILYNQANLPSLFIGFENDFNVPPIELIRFANETFGAFDYYSIPELNHYMTPLTSPSVPTSLGDTIIHWLRNNNLSVNSACKFDVSISLYPNPFFKTVTIYAPSPIANISITAMSGNILARQSNINKETTNVSLEALSSGVYLFHIQLNNGETIIKKAVRQ